MLSLKKYTQVSSAYKKLLILSCVAHSSSDAIDADDQTIKE
jgi:hypothetical protein